MPIYLQGLILLIVGTVLATATTMGTLLLVIRIQTARANRFRLKATQSTASI